jgi:uncharacterized protein (TIGR03083 family)
MGMFDIERVRQSWEREAAAIDAVVQTINDATASEPIRPDGWTAQDLLGHIGNAARGFLVGVRDGQVPRVDVDQFNEQQRQRGRQRAWPDTLGYWARVRDEITTFLAGLDSSIADKPVDLPHLPQIQTAGAALRVLIIHTRGHREELERGFAPVQA